MIDYMRDMKELENKLLKLQLLEKENLKLKKQLKSKSMRTEQDVLKDFQKLGYEVVCNSDRELILEQEFKSGYTIINRIHIEKRSQAYSKSQFAYCVGTSPLWVSMQEHKLLNELFTIWGWL